ncbi:hypothetical protein V1511DRAFT_505169 [Dipodascopsis uninucleata]
MTNKFRPKHQRLILQCYPSGRSQEKHPNPSELSYLLYYVSTRRTKLQKVGKFLDRKAKSDVWRGRAGNVQVTLDITKALIDRCPADLNLFVDDIISILLTVLGTNDFSLCQYTEATFKAFCENHDGALLVDDQEFVSKFEQLLRLYMSISKRTPHPTNDYGWILISLNAANSIASSEAMSASPSLLSSQVQIVIPIILKQLYSETEDSLVALNTKATNKELAGSETSTRTPRASTNTNRPQINAVDLDNEDSPETEAGILAIQALRKLFDTVSDTSAQQIRYASMAVVMFIINHPKNESWATTLIELMARWTPVQLRFIILRSLLEVLTSLSIHEISKQLVTVHLISSLLSSSVNLAGLSVLDVLHLLFSQILGHLHLETSGQVSDVQEHEKLTNMLISSIGDLATHIYYSNQIADMISEILMRLRPSSIVAQRANNNDGNTNENSVPNLENHSSDHSEPPSIVNSCLNLQYLVRKENSFKDISFSSALVVGLRAVKEIIQIANMMESGVKRDMVPLQTWSLTEWVLTDRNTVVRDAYVDAFLTYLTLEVSEDHIVFRNEKNFSATKGFLAKLHLALFDYALSDQNSDRDFMIINLLLLTVVENVGLYGIFRGLPMILHLHDVVHNNLSDPLLKPSFIDKQKISSKNLIALDSIVNVYFLAVSNKLGMVDFEKEVENDINRKINANEWDTNIQYPPKEINFGTVGDLEKRQSSSLPSFGVRNPQVKDMTVDFDGINRHEVKGDLGVPRITRSTISKYINQYLVKLNEDTRAELTRAWSKELIQKEDADTVQSSIADSSSPISYRFIGKTRNKPTRPVRSAW